MADEDEAALLAELRAISSRSAASRFQDNDNADHDSSTANKETAHNDDDAAALDVPRDNDDVATQEVVPPLTTKNECLIADPSVSNAVNDEIESSAASQVDSGAPPVESGRPTGGFASGPSINTFTGQRGGAAEDAELLAELRAISAKSSSRFIGGEENAHSNIMDDAAEQSTSTTKPVTKKLPKPSSSTEQKAYSRSAVPPWKRGKQKESVDVDIVVATPPPASPSKDSDRDLSSVSAEDAELIAELRAISTKVRNSPRFSTNDSGEISVNDSPSKLEHSASPKKVGFVHAEPATSSPPTDSQGGGFKPSIPSTFTGDRGGTAEDAELLAELRAISAKSSSSDRFAGVDTDGASGFDSAPSGEPPISAEPKPASPPRIKKVSPASEKKSLAPPWKRGKKNTPGASEFVDVDVVVAAPPATPQEAVAEEAGFKSSLPSTFTGNRGGAAEDAELLAELKAISAKSRFGDEEGEVADAGNAQAASLPSSEPLSPNQKAPSKQNGKSSVPPWKRRKQKPKSKSVDVDVVVASPPKAPPERTDREAQGSESSLPSTLTGDRGAATENTESSSDARFAEKGDDDGGIGSSDVSSVPPIPSFETDTVPISAAAETAAVPLSNITPVSEKDSLPSQSQEFESQGGGFNSSLPSTFTGDRGGAAEDAELLAELRAISAKSSSSNRFGGVTDEDIESSDAPSMDIVPSSSAVPSPKPVLPSRKDTSSMKMPSSVPPWKRGKTKASTVAGVDVVVGGSPKGNASHGKDEVTVKRVDSPRKSSEKVEGFKSSLPSTFSGEHGGTAEDAELLAELRAVSAKSGSSARFTSDSSDTANASDEQETLRRDELKSSSRSPSRKDASLDASVGVVPQRASPAQEGGLGGGFKSSLPSTFRGDRGGAAEDAELLAELRAISSTSSNGARFNQEEGATGGLPSDTHETPVPEPTSSATTLRPTRYATPVSQSSSPSPFPPVTPAEVDEEFLVTRESLPSAVTDKKWKLRKNAYDLLCDLFKEAVAGKEAMGDFDAESIMHGLDGALSAMMADSNASALDSALHLGNIYADYCQGAASADQAAAIVTSLLKGSAFSSSRPSTSKLCASLTLKLMEVGTDGVASVHSVTDVLLAKGLTSRKPKVVLSTVNLIFEAANKFGAGCLPLAAISSSAPKMLAHSNAKVRDTGMKIIAEICRATGSKAPLQDVISNLKKAQASQLDALLEAQPQPHPVEVQLRSKRHASTASQSPDDVLAAFEAGAKELEAKRLAARPAVNIFEELPKTDYSTRIKLPKWSEKVGALDTLLQCGGEKPYKLVQPSSSANYGPVVAEMKSMLSHTHFAVSAKSMEVLSMLASGVGERMFPLLRPMLSPLLQLSKDKKLTRSVGSCLDTLFGNVLSFDHLLDKEGALPSELDERKQKNALVRCSALGYLQRCVERREASGPRGKLTVGSSEKVARLCCEKARDSDAGVRKALTAVLQSLMTLDDSAIADAAHIVVEEELKTKYPRVYKSLKGKPASAAASSMSKVSGKTNGANSKAQPSQLSPTKRTVTGTSPRAKALNRSPPVQEKATAALNPAVVSDGDLADAAPSIDEALSQVSALCIPEWSASEDNGGVLAGLKSSKWLSRQGAIKALAAFSSKEFANSTAIPSGAILVVVKEHTKGFKESNFNVVKAIFELFLALCEAHEKANKPFCGWACRDGTNLAVEKIADRKLSSMSLSLLTALCVVRNAETVMRHATAAIEKVKAPVSHETLLKWCKQMFTDFGASTIAQSMKELVQWILEECGSANLKVRNAAFLLVRELHSQLGPGFRVVSLSLCTDSTSIKGQLDTTFQQHPFDPSAAKAERPKKCIVMVNNSKGSEQSVSASLSFGLDIPRTDLVAALPNDCINMMGSKEGKTAWKMRKEALDEVAAELEKCSGMVSTTNLKSLVQLLRALKERMSDSQSNLKPVAARIIGSILSSVDTVSQAKLGKVVYASLINAVMNDNRKPMREASLEALRVGTQLSPLEGSGPNILSLEPLMVALVGELGESELKGGGIPAMLLFVTEVSGFLPNMEAIVSSRAESLGEKFASAIVKCLTSSKSETRGAAESLLKACLESGSICMASVKKGSMRLLPAQRRSVEPVLTRLRSSIPGSEKENLPSKAATAARTKSSVSSSPRGAKNTSARRSQPASFVSRQDIPIASIDKVAHPLRTNVPASSTTKEARLSSRNSNWPEHPEEPSSTSQLNGLKKLWTPLLPSSSVSVLFPAGGIRKQDDAMQGCELLARVIQLEREGSDKAIVDQLDLVFKWAAFSLCSRDNTVGLQSLLSLLVDLLRLLCQQRYALTTSEANILLPIVYEKTGAAKGRFLDQFNDLILIAKSKDIVPPNKLGPVICVSLIERSHHARTRVLAYRDCQECVDRVGLVGIGKRGVLLTAKKLTEETLPENRSAALDLMESVLAKMDGDIKRLARVCGPSNLSDKAKTMLEDRWRKHGGEAGSVTTTDEKRRHSQIPSAKKSLDAFGSSHRRQTIARPRSLADKPNNVALTDELPALQLRLGDKPSSPSTRAKKSSEIPAEGPFTFSFQQTTKSLGNTQSIQKPTDHTRYEGKTSTNLDTSILPPQQTDSPSKEIGAAASLRARLLKLREQNRISEGTVPPPTRDQTTIAKEIESSVAAPSVLSGAGNESTIKTEESTSDMHSENIRTIEALLKRPTPVGEDDAYLDDCNSALKKFHSALSNQSDTAAPGKNVEISLLRKAIGDNLVSTIEHVTSVIGYAFDCGEPERNAGICVFLLSTALATLMALFRDEELARMVPLEPLTLLIRETGKALLDSRLAAKPPSSSASQLDQKTSEQLVRAINKLAIQAAKGATRHVSLQALMMLQLQLCSNNRDSTGSEIIFNKRFSRVVTNLFARVLKAEEATEEPFSSQTIDIEALLCSIEDHLSTCSDIRKGSEAEDNLLVECSRMAKTLVTALVKSRSAPGGIEEIRHTLDDLGIHPRDSLLASLITTCEMEIRPTVDTSPDATSATNAVDVATLVSNVGSASEGPERKSALDALRRYKEVNGDAELMAHLEEVSTAFRAYILEQLSTSRPEIPGRSTVVNEDDRKNVLPMSERIKQLKSKLHATEAVVQSAVDSSDDPLPSPTSQTRKLEAPIASVKTESTPKSSPQGQRTTNLPKPGFSSLRKRLAASQESRNKSERQDFSPAASYGRPTSSVGHAAALRARLEAVKQGKQQQNTG